MKNDSTSLKYTNIKKVNVNGDKQIICLAIELNVYADNDFIICYQKALSENGSYTSLYGSGAPTVNRVKFDGYYAYTDMFPSYGSKDDTKQFLIDFDSYMTIAKKEYANLQLKKQRELARQAKIQEETKKELENLNDFFNNGMIFFNTLN